jgi:hypothetical protein
MTAASIGAAKGGGYARYLESKTVEPERGDYYLTPGGEPTQAPGLTSPRGDEELFMPLLHRCLDVPWILEAPPRQD